MIKAMAHVCFTVTDLDRSLKFYCDGLGLKHAFDFKNEQGRRFGVYLHVGHRSFVELFEGKLAQGALPPSFRHICLEVDDIQETVKTLKARGIQVGDIKMGSDQSWQAWLADPDGNNIELHQYTPKSWQAPALGGEV